MLALVLSAGFLALGVTVNPARIERRAAAKVEVVVRGLPQGSRSVRLWASVGTLGAPHLDPDGTARARYQPPESGPPGFAVIAAWDERSGEAAVASVELYGRVEIPVETDPGAEVTVKVASRHVSARADAQGSAHVSIWVPPGVRRARVTAADPAGNLTVTEVALDVPPPIRVWLLAPTPPARSGDPVRVYAFSLAPDVPRLSASGAPIEVSERPEVSTGLVRVSGEVTVTARVEGGRAETVLRPTDRAPPGIVALGARDPRDELGVSLGPRYSGPFFGVALTGEWRRRLGASRFHLGIDVAALYASGRAGSRGIALGAGLARAVFEARFSVGERVMLTCGAAAGAVLAGEQRTPARGAARSALDGGPSLALEGSLLLRAGTGLFTVTAGYAWTPLVGLGLSVADGALLSFGYRWFVGGK